MDEKNTSVSGTPSNTKFFGLALAAALIVAVGGFAYFKKVDAPITASTSTPTTSTKENDSTAPTSPQPTPTPVTKEQVETATVKASVFKDGMYTTQGAYTSPAGKETVGITLTIKDDVIVAATGEVLATNAASQKFQTQFVAGFGVQVVGKKLSEVSLDKVSGSSLTPKGFNDAVLKIQADAKA
ncbi:hypothetical protein K2X96_02200 [Patescibacteria group bacterium]|nr:hypothetical protein [Patescibacteria group bacterium]